MDWKIKLKTNKTLQNSQEKEMRNQKNKEKIEKKNTWQLRLNNKIENK